MKPLDYSIYNRVKAKFPPQVGVVFFVSLSAENLETLDGLPFTIETIDSYGQLVSRHSVEGIPFALIGGFGPGETIISLSCEEYEQEEDLVTGIILASSVGTFNRPIDIEAVKKDLKKLSCGVVELIGNA